MRFFRINVSGTKFFLSERNLLSDAPNLFTKRFAKELAERTKGSRMAIDKSPATFEYIHRHLQGYEVVPSCIPPHLLKHVRQDAEFYELHRLCEKLMTTNSSEYFPLVDHDRTGDGDGDGDDDEPDSDADSDSDALLDLVNERRMAGRFLDNIIWPESEPAERPPVELLAISRDWVSDWEDTWEKPKLK